MNNYVNTNLQTNDYVNNLFINNSIHSDTPLSITSTQRVYALVSTPFQGVGSPSASNGRTEFYSKNYDIFNSNSASPIFKNQIGGKIIKVIINKNDITNYPTGGFPPIFLLSNPNIKFAKKREYEKVKKAISIRDILKKRAKFAPFIKLSGR